MKRLLILVLLSLVLQDAFSQLSTRVNSDFTPKLQTRPSAGDAALQFVFPIVNLTGNNQGGLYTGNTLSAGDMLTFKYYKTDDLVYRAGIRLFASNQLSKGTAADSTEANTVFDTSVSENNLKATNRQYNIAGGIEKHFWNSNIFDVYMGGEALIGLGKVQTRNEVDFFNGDKQYSTTTTNTTIFGLGGVVGFNLFIAELPVAIGLEYGLSGKAAFGGKTKVKEEMINDAAGISYTNEYETQTTDALNNPDGRQYSKLGKRTFNMDTNNTVRILIHIFFGTKSK